MQSLLQSITHHLPSLILDPAKAILGPQCFETLVWDADLTSIPCLKLGISKALGLGIVVFGSIMKLPQIVKILRARSARGISLAMYALEVWAYTISLAYAWRLGIPFSTYGENASLTVQNMIITLLIIRFAPRGTARLSSLGSSVRLHPSTVPLSIAAALMLLGSLAVASPSIIPPGLLAVLQATTIPVSLASKVPQMAELHRDKAPGQLSAIVVFAQLAGTIARVFTTATETSDKLLLWGYGLATIFNAVIAAQYVYYWDGNDRFAKRRPSLTLPVSAPSAATSQPWTEKPPSSHAAINMGSPVTARKRD